MRLRGGAFLEIRKARRQHRPQKFEMLDALGKGRQSLLASQDLRIEQVLVVLLDGVSGQIFVLTISRGDGSAGHYIIDTGVQTSPLGFGG